MVPRHVDAVTQALPYVPGFDPDRVIACLSRFVAFRLSGQMPKACRGMLIVASQNVAPFLFWGRSRSERRSTQAGSTVILVTALDDAGLQQAKASLPLGLTSVQPLMACLDQPHPGNRATRSAVVTC